jgi:sulfonate transport system substrate-binding protein
MVIIYRGGLSMFNKTMSFRTTMVLFSMFLLCFLVLSGCQSPGTEPEQKPVEKPDFINISYSYRPLNVPAIVALEKKLFEEEFAKEGIEVKWYELEGPATTEALAAKSLDIATSLNYVSAIISKANGNDIKLIASYSKFPKGIGLVAGAESGITKIVDLQGKKIALQQGTMLHEMLIKALEQENIPVNTLEIINMPSPDALNALMDKHVDAAIIPEPLLTKAISSQKVKLVQNAEGLILGQATIAARSEFAEKYPEIVKKFLEIHNNILNWSVANEEEALNITSEVIQMDTKAVKALYPKFDFSLEITEDNTLKLKESADFLKANNFIKGDIDTKSLIDSLVDTSYLPQ